MATTPKHMLEIVTDNTLPFEFESNKSFIVTDELALYENDEYCDTSNVAISERDVTPAPPDFRTGLMRLHSSHQPKRPERGFTFGSTDACDIRIDAIPDHGVSRLHFTIRPMRDPGMFIICNESKQGTLMRDGDDLAFTMVRVQRAFGRPSGYKFAVRCGLASYEFVTPDHTEHLDEFHQHWEAFYNRVTPIDPPERDFGNFTIGYAPSSTRQVLDYYLDNEVNRGYKNDVFRAVNKLTAEVFALKKFTNLELAQNEARVLKKINHPNIVKFYEIKYDPPELFVEYLKGSNLDLTDKSFRFSLHDLHAILLECLEALAYLAENGITNRDIKPENIIVYNRNPVQVKLIDFDIASTEDNMRYYEGTEHYMAPEIVDRKVYTSKVDVWSLGASMVSVMAALPRPGSSSGMDYADLIKVHLFQYCCKHHLDSISSFLLQMLQTDPLQRPSARQALGHEFIGKVYSKTQLPPREPVDDSFYMPDTLPSYLPFTIFWGSVGCNSFESVRKNSTHERSLELTKEQNPPRRSARIAAQQNFRAEGRQAGSTSSTCQIVQIV